MRPLFAALLLTTSALAQAPAPGDEPEARRVYYYGPSERGPVEQYQFTQFKPGDTAYLGVHEVNLRKQADASSAVVKVLPLGAAVTIKAVASEALRVGYRVDRWYEVEAPEQQARGFLFGGTLTAAAFRFDFDGNGTVDVAAAAWMPNYKIKVRVLSDGVLSEVVLEPGGQAYACCGGQLAVSVLDAKAAGVPLLRVESTVEACGDYRVYLVSFWDELPRQALEMGGLADPPSYAEPRVTFFPEERRCRVDTKSWIEAEEGGESEVDVGTTWYALKRGVFVPIKPPPK